MTVDVEMGTDLGGDLRCVRISLSRVPAVGESVRVLSTVNGGTAAFVFKVTSVVHAASSPGYPRREGQIDAWIDAVMIEPGRWT